MRSWLPSKRALLLASSRPTFSRLPLRFLDSLSQARTSSAGASPVSAAFPAPTVSARARRSRRSWLVAMSALLALLLLLSWHYRGAPPTGAFGGMASVSAGGSHTCALTMAAGPKCWGDNIAGQLGDGTNSGPQTCGSEPCSTVLVGVTGLTSGGAAVAAGGDHSCAVTTTGGLKCWGDNTYGELGDGTTTSRTTPVDVVGLTSGVAAVAAGAGLFGEHTCALTTAGGVKCWGANFYGQLGNGQACPFICSTPVDVSGLTSGAAAISAGSGYACAVTTGGGVKCWGDNSYGELGDGTTTGSTIPLDVMALTSGVTAVSAGGDHACAVTMAGGLKCWGANQFGQLGVGTSSGPQTCGATTCSTTQLDVMSLTSGVAAVSAGGSHTCAVTMAGGLKCWGANQFGQLGVGTSSGPQTCGASGCSTTPVDVSILTSGVAATSAGAVHTCALTTAAGIQCWGANQFGQLGIGRSNGPQTCGTAALPCSTTPWGVWPCADLTGDGIVTAADILYVVRKFGTIDKAADLNGDGTVTAADILIVVKEFAFICMR